MNNIAVHRPGWALIVCFAGLAALIGMGIPFEPVLLFAAVTGMTLFLLSVLFPERMSVVILVTSVVSIQFIFQIQMMGMDLQSLYKLGVLLLTVPAIMKFGVHRQAVWPIAALFAMLLTTWLFSDRHPLLTASAPVKAFIGLAAPFVFLLVRWSRHTAEWHIRTIVFMPLISVAVGLALQAAGLTAVMVTEFNGAFRLQGANIPAHLAFLAYIAFLVSIMELKRNPQKVTFYYVMMAVNFLILLLTGTRGPLLAAFPMVLVFLFDLTRQFVKGKTALIVPLFGFVAVLVVSVYLQLDNFQKRSFERQTDTGIDLSGRSEAWAFFLDGARDSPWFGRGLGSVLVANDGSIYKGFVVPHNEYIRFYYDGGVLGAILLFAALIAVFGFVYCKLPSPVRLYFGALLLGFFIYSFSDNTLSTIQFIVPFCVYLCALVNLSGYIAGKGGNDEQSRFVWHPVRQL